MPEHEPYDIWRDVRRKVLDTLNVEQNIWVRKPRPDGGA